MAFLDNILKRKSRDEFLARDNSKAQVKGYSWGSSTQNIFPDFTLAQCEAMINDDPVARGALKHHIDRFMEGDMTCIKKDTRKQDDEQFLRLQEKYMFREKIIRELARKLVLYNNAFIEIVRSPLDNKVIDLNVLDSSTLEPKIFTNGDLKALYQTPVSGSVSPIEWDIKNIIWLKNGDKSKGFAPVDMRSLWETLLAKSYVKRFVAWLWETGQYRLYHQFMTGADKDINDFKVIAKRAESDFKIPILLRGDLVSKVQRDMKEQDSIINLLNYYDNQILVEMRVSPVDAGKPDESGRSNADASQNAGDAFITSLKKTVQDYINFDLFKKMNLGNTLLVFEPNNRFSVTKLLENIQLMKSCGFTDDACKEYMESKGLFFKSDKLFNEPEEKAESPDNPRDKDQFESRQGKGSGEKNQNQDEVTTRAEQTGAEN